MWSVYISSLVIGLSASLHCAGMCGPLVMAIPMKSSNRFSKAFGILQYHLGKILIYALLGLTIGFVGMSVQLFRWMQWLSVVSGVLVILFAWAKFTKFSLGGKLQQLSTRFSGNLLRRLFKSDMPLKPFFFGLINGLLPCGLIYIALVNSLLAKSPTNSALAMVFFGLGTVPVLTAVRFVSSKFNWRSNRLVPLLITAVGLLMILRGLNLGIPYVSPKVEHQVVVVDKKEISDEVVMSCCVKKSDCKQ